MGNVIHGIWPTKDSFIWLNPVEPPSTWTRPGMVMFFNLECPGCVARAIPLFKRYSKDYGDELELALIHTAFGHKPYSRDDVIPTLKHFAKSFAKLENPIALDLTGKIAESWEILGTPHWLLFHEGELLKSIFGSQDNARTRLGYTLSELLD